MADQNNLTNTIGWTAIPPEMQQCPYWVGWQFKDKTQTAMRAFHFEGMKNVLKSDVLWSSLAEAKIAVSSPLFNDGIGFGLSPIDNLCGIDLDHCRDPKSGAITKSAREIVEAVNSYTEISPLGDGLHIFLRANVRSHMLRKSGLKLFSERHFLPVTGHTFESFSVLGDRTDALVKLWSKTTGKCIAETRRVLVPSLRRPLDPLVPKDDQTLLHIAMRVNHDHKLKDLWNNKKFRPGACGANKDFSLCLRLAYWCGPDPLRVDRLFRSSKRMSDTWGTVIGPQGETYGRMLSEGAVKYQQRFSFHKWQ
jgi:putative DNA primase/helicase